MHQFSQVESERDALSDRVQGLQRFIESLEHQVKDQAHQLSEARDEAAQSKATATQMRYRLKLLLFLFLYIY